MRFCVIFACFLLQIGLTICHAFDGELSAIDSELSESKKHIQAKKASVADDLKKYDAGEFDSKHHSSKGDKGIESYDKTSSWVKKVKGSHNRKLGDEAKKQAKEKNSYSKDPDYSDENEDDHNGNLSRNKDFKNEKIDSGHKSKSRSAHKNRHQKIQKFDENNKPQSLKVESNFQAQEMKHKVDNNNEHIRKSPKGTRKLKSCRKQGSKKKISKKTKKNKRKNTQKFKSTDIENNYIKEN